MANDPKPATSPKPTPKPRSKRRTTPRARSPAAWACERIILYIRAFEGDLDDGHEMALSVAGSDGGVLAIESLGFFDPDMVSFYGTDEDGAKMQLIQHISQINLALRAVPKAEGDDPARRIGFLLTAQWLGGEAGDASAG